VDVEAVLARRKAGQRRREHQAIGRFLDRDLADVLALALGVDGGHRDRQVGQGRRAERGRSQEQHCRNVAFHRTFLRVGHGRAPAACHRHGTGGGTAKKDVRR